MKISQTVFKEQSRHDFVSDDLKKTHNMSPYTKRKPPIFVPISLFFLILRGFGHFRNA